MSERDERSVPRGRNAKRVAGAVGCLGAAAVAAANVASAAFNGGQSVSPSVGAGTLYLQLGNGGVNRLTTAVTGLYPTADNSNPTWRDRAVDVKNAGSLDLASLKVSVAASGSDLTLATDSNGIYMFVDECSVAWTETAGSSPNEYSYTCSGTRQDVISTETSGGFSLGVQPTNNDGSAKTTTFDQNITYTAGATNHLRFRFKLPAGAPNTLQGKSVTLTMTFDGTQRAAQYK